ncbi:hypothetical protein SS50377_23269 [Spironucleus salmonicida]|uniref:Uncharacterized protein n=1 Tax=Spironucleus salmonicida TaxID=348837 RepID=V6LIB6_9EUKA|nr:hypothetical protein SS50377_23269 [Spironucleus salmonicida]|eukprot:EST44058.1 Hypothetical protein SS50377_16124 [Spironucleus salmonicida]
MKVDLDDMTFYYSQNGKQYCFNDGKGIEFDKDYNIVDIKISDIKIQKTQLSSKFKCFYCATSWFCQYESNIYKLEGNQSTIYCKNVLQLLCFGFQGSLYGIEQHNGYLYVFTGINFAYQQDLELEQNCQNSIYSLLDKVFLISSLHIFQLIYQSFNFSKHLVTNVRDTILLDSMLHLSSSTITNLITKCQFSYQNLVIQPHNFGWCVAKQTNTNFDIHLFHISLRQQFQSFTSNIKKKLFSQSFNYSNNNKNELVLPTSKNKIDFSKTGNLTNETLSSLVGVEMSSSFTFSESENKATGSDNILLLQEINQKLSVMSDLLLQILNSNKIK